MGAFPTPCVGAVRTSSLPRIASQSIVPIHDRAGQHARIWIDSGMPQRVGSPANHGEREPAQTRCLTGRTPPAPTVPQTRAPSAGTRRHATAAMRPEPRDSSRHGWFTSPRDTPPCGSSPCGSLCFCSLSRCGNRCRTLSSPTRLCPPTSYSPSLVAESTIAPSPRLCVDAPSLSSRTSLSRGLRKQPEEGSSDGISVTVSRVETVIR